MQNNNMNTDSSSNLKALGDLYIPHKLQSR